MGKSSDTDVNQGAERFEDGEKAGQSSLGNGEGLGDQAAAAGHEARSFMGSAAEQQKERAADRIEGLAAAMHESGEQFAGQQDLLAGLIERGADELGALAVTLRKNDLAGLTGRLQDLARQQPALFAGLSIAAGFGAVRLVKAALRPAARMS